MEVSVYGFVIDRDLGFDVSCLSELEKNRAARFKFEKHRYRWINTRIAVKNILARLLQISPTKVEFVLGESGKPSLIPALDHKISFNISHSSNFALLAIVRESGVQLGVDIEEIVPVRELESLAEHYFASEEREMLLSVPEASRTAAFFRLWTRKEAYVKAIGTGLTVPLQNFAVTLSEEDVRFIHLDGDTEAASSWGLHNLTRIPGYAAAVALPVANSYLRYRSFESLNV